MTTTGVGVYFDGRTSRRQDVHVALGDGLVLVAPDGRTVARWAFSDLREASGLPGTLRLTLEGGSPLARLDIRDPALGAAVRGLSPNLGVKSAAERTLTLKVVSWSLAAVASGTLFALVGVPALASQIAPLLPWSFDQRMGAAADDQIRALLPVGDGGFACGAGPGEAEGRAALDVLARRLSDAAALPVPIEIVAVRSGIRNAFALPGGYVYLFKGLIEKATSADEIAGVMAHEIGHVANRDGTRRALQAGGTSLMLGFVLGDFIGGGAAIAIVQAVTEASYSRTTESAADGYAVAMMRRLGGDPKGLGTLLTRLTDDQPDEDETEKDGDAKAARSPFDYLASHPATRERQRAIEALAGDGPATPLLTNAQFAALKRICGADGGE